MQGRKWTKEEEIIVFNLYCKIPFKSSSKNHPEVIKIANLIGRSPSSVNMKIGNFGSFDDNLRLQGIVGLSNASKLDKAVWDEFNNNWEKLAYESEILLQKYINNKVHNNNVVIPLGKEVTGTVKQRVNQKFFRDTVLASYNNCCCITGLANRELLIASHIKPWSISDENEKTNPSNGICLNALHDKAFDKGFITIDTNYVIHISKCIKDIFDGKTVDLFFNKYNNTKILLPEKFLPESSFLEYHSNFIFEKWK